MNTMTLSSLENIQEADEDHSCTSYADADPEQAVPKLAKNETKAVVCLRVGLTTVLLSAALLVSLGIYFFTRGTEESEFQSAFADQSTKILENFQQVADRRLGSIAAFGSSITAHTLATNASFPFVTIPAFEEQASHVLSLSGADSVSLWTIVEPEDRPVWENEWVPSEGPRWINESMTYANKTDADSFWPGWRGVPEQEYIGKPSPGSNGITYKQIFNRNSAEQVPIIAKNETNIVFWQISPIDPSFARGWINLNARYDSTFEPRGNLLNVLQRKRSALGRMSQNSYGARPGGPPISGFYVPVLTDFTSEARVGATIASLFPWESFFENILPKNAKGLVTVLKNSCDQAFTWMIDGAEASFLGEGDLHDSNYNGMMQEVSFTTLINQGVEDGTFQGFPLDEEGCQYSLQVYASSDMEQQYISNMPIIFMVVALLIFAFTSFVFVVYDRLVEKRQNIVENEAKKSGAIVSSLFPSAYKDKLMDEQEQKMQQQKSSSYGKMDASEASRKLSHLMSGGEEDATFACEDQIADNYPDCTVFFADVSNFTNWAAKRAPSEVFILLQTLFARFDKSAKRRGVFKVETIGDCYLAVTGLPNAQENHALIMARFANACMVDFNECVRGLSDKLGNDTLELNLRVGLHSGSVTAGILRGEKSRFQVFGDTVNTASRMESSGEAGRIHLSATTASILCRKHNKRHWLIAREGQITPKGKEPMQTFWLNPERTASSHASTHITAPSSSVTSNAFPSVEPPPLSLTEQFAV